jgi:hypothetical protein
LFSLKGAPSKESLVDVESDKSKKSNSETPTIEAVDERSNNEPAQLDPPMDEDLEETQLEEAQVEETPQIISEEPAAMDDEEPLEWEESDVE